MSTKTNKISATACQILSFAAALRGRECPPNCLEIGGRPWRMSGSYEHVTDKRERCTHTHALPHIDTHTHTRTQKTRERETDRKIGRLGVKNANTREAIRNITVQKTLSMSDMILKFFFIALNSKTDWTLQNLPTEIVNKNMERFKLHLQPPRM